MKNKIEDLRNHLFMTLEALQDQEDPMDVARAKAVADVASVLIESAKTEVRFLEVMGARAGQGTGFMPIDAPPSLPKFGGK